jgi:hypothetical protein
VYDLRVARPLIFHFPSFRGHRIPHQALGETLGEWYIDPDDPAKSWFETYEKNDPNDPWRDA